jgi:hypothetical protein
MSILDEIKVNRTPTHMVRPAALELQKKTKVIMGEYVERIKRPGEVNAPALSIWERGVYRSGDGDSMRQVPREGSLKAFSLPSRGNKT